ncbi:TetR/AcrR family transcriptional regulator [Ohtaekwangia kribbensis]|uniref:TetR/AcrR family transcriptional regulator n=1 Tax=Ohtaekwangia kribbensis TaxID=688913 RepID=A0ABW3K0V3_9BACT
MTIAERKNKEKEEMSKRILDGARRVFLKNGYERTSMRNIAEEINYSPGTLYFYFKDKGEIFNKLHEEGFRLLLAKCKVLDNVADPFERLKAVGKTFIQFATENKDYYNLMFLVDEADDYKKGGLNVATDAINHLAATIKACQEKGHFKDMKTDYLTFMILSSIHGICALFCKDRTQNFKDHTTDDLIKNGYECFTMMLERA